MENILEFIIVFSLILGLIGLVILTMIEIGLIIYYIFDFSKNELEEKDNIEEKEITQEQLIKQEQLRELLEKTNYKGGRKEKY